MVYGVERVMKRERFEGKVEIAKELLARKIDIDTVSEITKLPLATIRKLVKEIGQ